MTEQVRKDQLYSLLSKIRRLAEHPNTPDNEAAAAMCKFRQLLIKYNLQESEISDEINAPCYEELEVTERARIHLWQKHLAGLIAEFTGCIYLSGKCWKPKPRYSISFFGNHADTIYAEQLFKQLSAGFQAAAKHEWAKRVALKHAGYHYKEHQYKREFLTGCIFGLDRKLSQLEKTQTAYKEDKALMVSQREVISRHLEQEMGIPKQAPKRLYAQDSTAFMLGYLTGKEANINHAIDKEYKPSTEYLMSVE